MMSIGKMGKDIHMKIPFKITVIIEADSADEALKNFQEGKKSSVHYVEVIKFIEQQEMDISDIELPNSPTTN